MHTNILAVFCIHNHTIKICTILRWTFFHFLNLTVFPFFKLFFINFPHLPENTYFSIYPLSLSWHSFLISLISWKINNTWKTLFPLTKLITVTSSVLTFPAFLPLQCPSVYGQPQQPLLLISATLSFSTIMSLQWHSLSLLLFTSLLVRLPKNTTWYFTSHLKNITGLLGQA